MAANDWISLSIHPDHAKVRRLAQLTGDSIYEACGRAVAWFRFVDQNFDGPETGLDDAQVNDVVGVRAEPPEGRVSYAEAMADPKIGWIGRDAEGLIVVEGFEQWFSQSAKRRARKQLRQRRYVARQAMEAAAEPAEPADPPAQSPDDPRLTLLLRMGLPLAHKLVPQVRRSRVTTAQLVRLWADRRGEAKEKRPGRYIAKLAAEDQGEGVKAPTPRQVFEAVDAGVVSRIGRNGHAVDLTAGAVEYNRDGLWLDGRKVTDAGNLGDVEYA
jgi:hypothetical protein